MGIEVADSALAQVRELPDQMLLEAAAPDAIQLARSAIASARRDIGALCGTPNAGAGRSGGGLHGVKFVSEVIPTADGAALLIDGGSTPQSVLETIPDIIARHLTSVGVDHAVIAAPTHKAELTHLDRVPRAVILRAGGPPPYRRGRGRVVPPALLEAAAAWLREGMCEGESVRVRTAGIEFELAGSGVRDYLHSAHRSGVVHCNLVVGQLDDRIRCVTGCFSGGSLSLAAGGPKADDTELARRFTELREVARRNAQGLAYAFIDIAESFGAITHTAFPSRWSQSGGEHPRRVERACDEALFDAFPYQLLGPRHVARLGDKPPGARPVPGTDFLELELGHLDEWMPRHPPLEATRASAREVLRPCLMMPGEAVEIIKRRTQELLS